MTGRPYQRGVHEVADGVFAWLQPDGGWGWSNAGLVTSGTESLLVDTLYDLRLTRDMLDGLARASSAATPIDVLVNTHANGDHTYGNQLVGPGPHGMGAEIIASRRCAEEFAAVTPETMQSLLRAAPDLGALGRFVARAFGAFDFAGISIVPPTRTFDGLLPLTVGELTVELIEVGPAHTAGDVVVWVPARGVLFTGDIVFNRAHPVVWAGPLAGWITACERLTALAPEVVVPGHGPITDAASLGRLAGYFRWLQDEAAVRLAAGQEALEAADELARSLPDGPYADWAESERLAVNVVAAYRDIGAPVADDVRSLLTAMAALADRP